MMGAYGILEMVLRIYIYCMYVYFLKQHRWTERMYILIYYLHTVYINIRVAYLKYIYQNIVQ